MNLNNIKSIVEKNPVVVATIMDKNKPNAVAVAFAKVIENKILITDNFMNQTVKDLKKNNSVCLLVWNKKWEGYKVVGRAKYFSSGKWLEFVKKMKENKNLPAKGAILVEPRKIIKLS